MDQPGALAAPLATLRTELSRFAAAWLPAADRWCVALSGGPDSVALTAVAAGLLPTTALIVDHRLQPGSARVAARARTQALALGCVDARVLTVTVGTDGGPEAAARRARYAALAAARDGAPVLVGHTLDDQAETVLLGLGRGSGARSLAGMARCDPPWYRPLLGVRRALTHAACAALGVDPWTDPHNTDPRFTRARLRTEVLPLLEEVLGGGVAEALARTATALREDTAVLDALAAAAAAGAHADGGALAVAAVAPLPGPVRRRVIRSWLLDGGARGLSDRQIRRIDALVTDWRGQGGVAVGSALTRRRLVAARDGAVLVLRSEPVGR